jgi:hypothetical protein
MGGAFSARPFRTDLVYRYAAILPAQSRPAAAHV